MSPQPAQPKKSEADAPAAGAPALEPQWLRALLAECRGVRLRLTGGSMAPAVRGGQVVEVRAVCPADVRVGDVLLYEAPWSPSGLAAHRVQREAAGGTRGSPAGWWMRGDAPGGHAERIPPARVLGRVEAVQRRGRWVRVTTPLRRALGRWAAGTAAVWAVLARARRSLALRAGRQA